MSDHASATVIDPRDRLDLKTWNRLTGIDTRLLDELAFLSRCQARQSPRRRHYCTPGRKYLARRLGCSTTTISRHTSKLSALGMLDKIQRRPVQGKWQTCLYRLIHPAAWAAARLRHTIRLASNRVSQVTRLASPQKGNKQQEDPKGVFDKIIATWKARGSP